MIIDSSPIDTSSAACRCISQMIHTRSGLEGRTGVKVMQFTTEEIRRAEVPNCFPQVKLPDVDFLVNLGDYPLAKKTERRYSPQVPIFSWCGSEDSLDIVMPTYELTEASVHMMRRVVVDVLSVQVARFLLFLRTGSSKRFCFFTICV